MSKMQTALDVGQEFKAKNYDKITDYANGVQEELIHNWQVKNREELKHLILVSRNILNFWVDSIVKNRLWIALVRCGAWIGTLETIERSVYEESMDMWLQKRITKKISSIKHLPEILHLLEVKGVMAHGELAEKLNLNHPSTLTEIMKKTEDLDLVMMKRSGKYKLYSLTDAGIRYAKQIRSRGDEEALLGSIIKKYDLRTNEEALDARLRSLGNEENGVLIKPGQDIGIITDTNKKMQNVKVEKAMKTISYNKEEKAVLLLKSKIEPVNYEKEA